MLCLYLLRSSSTYACSFSTHGRGLCNNVYLHTERNINMSCHQPSGQLPTKVVLARIPHHMDTLYFISHMLDVSSISGTVGILDLTGVRTHLCHATVCFLMCVLSRMSLWKTSYRSLYAHVLSLIINNFGSRLFCLPFRAAQWWAAGKRSGGLSLKSSELKTRACSPNTWHEWDRITCL